MKATDLALARAAQNGRGKPQEIKTADIGGGWGFMGFELAPMKSPDGETLAAMLFAVGTRQSLIASTTVTIVRVPVAPLAEVKLERLREAFEKASGPGEAGDAG